MTNYNFKIADLYAVVPAVRPAWIHLVQLYDYETGEREWADDVMPVLAYASARLEDCIYNAYYAKDGNEPVWLVNYQARYTAAYHILDCAPTKGIAPNPDFVEGRTYCKDGLMDGGDFGWIF